MEIKIADIIIGPRLRPIGDITGLKESIATLGLLQPITINSDFRLIAGHHRIAAFKALGRETIPATVVDFSDLEAELAEIDENLRRNELTQFEQATHHARRKEIYEALYPEARHGGNAVDAANSRWGNDASSQLENSHQEQQPSQPPSYSESAAAITSQSRQTVARQSRRGRILKPLANLIIGSRFEDNGKELDYLVKIADPKKGEGAEVARQVLEIALQPGNERLKINQAYIQFKKARAAADVTTPAPAAPDQGKMVEFDVKPGQVWLLGRHKLICGNAYDYISDIKADALITDPPYGIDYRPNWNKWDGTPGQFISVIGDNEAFDPAPFLNYNTVLLFGANYFSARLPVGGWLCWDKRTREELDQMAGSPFELAWYRSQHTSRRAIMERIQHGGVVNADSEIGNNEKRLHPTQKPVELMRRILVNFTQSEEVVFDPFSGSGSTLIACQKTNRICIASEIDPEYCRIALERFHNIFNILPCQE